MNREYLDRLLFYHNMMDEKKFFDCLKSSSFLEFRKNINMVQDMKPSYFLEKKVIEYYEELLGKYQEKSDIFLDYVGLLDIFQNQDYESLEEFKNFNEFVDEEMIIQLEDFWHYRDGMEQAYEYLKRCTGFKISEIVVDGLFQDTIYNVWMNIREMLQYLNSLDDSENLLTEEKIKFYQDILKIDKMKNLEKIRMFDKLKDKNISLMFYQDLKRIKKHSYEKLKSCLLRLEQKEDFFLRESTQKYGVPIYELNGEDFYMLISCRKAYSDLSKARRHCYSLISSFHLNVFSKNKFIYGYLDFDVEHIAHVFECDIESASQFETNSFTTQFVNRIMTPMQLCSFNDYNEIQIVNKKSNCDNDGYDATKPSYLVVFDNIEEKHIKEAKRLHIPIVQIHTSKYLSKDYKNNSLELCVSDNIDKIYTNGNSLEKEKKLRR